MPVHKFSYSEQLFGLIEEKKNDDQAEYKANSVSFASVYSGNKHLFI